MVFFCNIFLGSKQFIGMLKVYSSILTQNTYVFEKWYSNFL